MTTVDQAYANTAKQFFASACLNGGWDEDCMVLTPDLSERETAWFEARGIQVARLDNIYTEQEWRMNTIPTTRFPALITLKYYLFKDEFRKWDTIIHMDTDIIIRGTIEELKEAPGFAAVRPPSLSRIRNHFLLDPQEIVSKRQLESLKSGFDLDAPAFNIGVFAFRPGSDSERGMFDKLRDLLFEYGRICKYPEQGMLNLVFQNKWKELPLQFNLGVAALEELKVPMSLVDGNVLHFNGRRKPWDEAHPFHGEWKSNLQKAKSIDTTSSRPARKPSTSKTLMTVWLLRALGKWKEFKKFYVAKRNSLIKRTSL